MTMFDPSETLVDRRIEQAAAVLHNLGNLVPVISEIGERLVEAYQRGNKLLMFGNGGSAADGQHVIAEFTGRYYHDRRALPAVALTANVSSLTGIGNDYGYENIFVRQLEAHAVSGDVAIGLSTSGTSPNVLRGLSSARSLGVLAVGMTGKNGAAMADVCDRCVHRSLDRHSPNPGSAPADLSHPRGDDRDWHVWTE